MPKRREFFRNALLAPAALAVQSPPAAAATEVSTPVSLQSLGGVRDNGKFDNARVFNEALRRGVTRLHVPPGSWHFLTPIDPIPRPMEIIGDGCNLSCLVRDYAARSPAEGFITAASGAIRLSRIGLHSGHHSKGGAGIALIARDNGNPDYSTLEDLYVSVAPGTSGTWDYALLIDGTARSQNPFGVRDVDIRNCNFFASTRAACSIRGGVAVSIRGGGMFPAGGSTGQLEVTGTRAVASHYVNVDVTYVGGVALSNCKFVNVRAAVIAGDITNDASAEDIVINGACTGNAQSAYTRGTYLGPSRSERQR
jgi:hypothetical protein